MAGDQCIQEDLLGLTFRISPHAFFQVNTPAAEVLYTVIQEWAQLDGGSTVLDVCCGTGTIGLTLAPVSFPALGKNIALLHYHEPEDSGWLLPCL